MNAIMGGPYDFHIDEPGDGEYIAYTITCDSYGGGTVSDTHILTNNTSVDLTLIAPQVSDQRVLASTTLTTLPFITNNQTTDLVTEYEYIVDIDGSEVGRDTYTTSLAGNTSETVDASIAYTTPGSGVVPFTVCLEHEDMPGRSCDSARLIIAAPECSDGIDNDSDGLIDFPADPGCTGPLDPVEDNVPPTISVDPAIVRQGDSFTLSWDPNGNPGCVLSANAGADGSTPGSATLTAERQTQYTIRCANGEEAGVTLQVIPNLFET